MLSFISVDVLNGIFHWATIVAIVLTGLSLAYKVIVVLRDMQSARRVTAIEDDYYPPQESDDYVVIRAEREYWVNQYENVQAGVYLIDTVEEKVRISVNNVRKDYKKGDEITLADDDIVCSLYADVTLRPKTTEQQN